MSYITAAHCQKQKIDIGPKQVTKIQTRVCVCVCVCVCVYTRTGVILSLVLIQVIITTISIQNHYKTTSKLLCVVPLIVILSL